MLGGPSDGMLAGICAAGPAVDLLACAICSRFQPQLRPEGSVKTMRAEFGEAAEHWAKPVSSFGGQVAAGRDVQATVEDERWSPPERFGHCGGEVP